MTCDYHKAPEETSVEEEEVLQGSAGEMAAET